MDKNKPNGCGPWFFGDLLYQGPDGVWHSHCVDHDEDYKLGGGFIDKTKSDWRLYIALIDTLQYKHWLNKAMLSGVALLYLIAITLFGFLTFNFKRR